MGNDSLSTESTLGNCVKIAGSIAATLAVIRMYTEETDKVHDIPEHVMDDIEKRITILPDIVWDREQGAFIILEKELLDDRNHRIPMNTTLFNKHMQEATTHIYYWINNDSWTESAKIFYHPKGGLQKRIVIEPLWEELQKRRTNLIRD